MLGGGRGWVVAAAAGAFALEALFTLLNFAGVPSTYRDAVQGAIIILAVAYAATTFRARRRGRALETSPVAPSGAKEPDPSPDQAHTAPNPSTQRADNETKGGS